MNNKILRNNLILFNTIIFLIIFSILFSFSTAAYDDSDDIGFKSIEVDDRYNGIDFSIETNNDIAIEYPEVNIKIIPPEGSKIIGISNKSIEIVLNENTDLIRYDKTISKFCPVNFKSSIQGTNEFEVEVYYNYEFYIKNTTDDYNNYTIEWGDGEITSGNGNIPPVTTYKYKKQGVYPLTISFTDSKGIKYVYQKNQTYQLSIDQYVKIWTVENKETVAVGSAGTIGTLTLIGIALTETGKYKILAMLLLAVPMFTKIQKEDVLDHFVRGQIYGYVKVYPGAHYNQIMRELDIKNGTLSYHLYILEKTGIIKSRKEGYRYRAFYPTEVKFPEKERYRLTELQINIIKLIQDNKGINQKNIAMKLGENHQTISYNIKVLQHAGIINTNRKGRITCCFVNQNLSDKLPI